MDILKSAPGREGPDNLWPPVHIDLSPADTRRQCVDGGRDRELPHSRSRHVFHTQDRLVWLSSSNRPFGSAQTDGSRSVRLMERGQQSRLHVAIIMDGNGRWAMRRGLPRVAGHRAGVASVRRVVERALDLGIARLTLYAFSSDNWRRPASEVESIFWLLRSFLRLETERLLRRGVRLQVIGRRDRLAKVVLSEIEKSEAATATGRNLHLRVAIDYSSRDAIANAAMAATLSLANEGSPPPPLFRQSLEQILMTDGGEVDLLIRTGGEKRLSDFLLWECAYAELVFTDRTWPEFDQNDFDAALHEFNRRERRFGEVPTATLQPPPRSHHL
jgi:undecaprenyl diphosphate synthase